MTETTYDAPPPDEPPPGGLPAGGRPDGPPPGGPAPGEARRLVRDPDDQVVAGVCAAFARYTGTDPVLWRVTVAVLAVFGGTGIALYLLGWLLLPRLGEAASPVERMLRRPDSSVATGGVVALVLLALLLVAMLDDGPGLVTLAVVGGIAFLVARERRSAAVGLPGAGLPGAGLPGAGAPAAPASETGPAWTPEPGFAGGTPLADGTVPWSPVGYDAPPAPWHAAAAPAAPPRPRSALGALTVSAALLVTGLLLTLRAAGVDAVTGSRVLAAALLVVGLGLVVGAWVGRARWLLALGLVLAIALGPVAALERVGPAGGSGSRLWVPAAGATGAAYQLGAGEATLDVRRLADGVDDGDAAAQVSARVGLGKLLVLVPEGATVEAVTDVGVGEVNVTGPDGDSRETGRGQDRQVLRIGPPGPTDVELDLRVGLGEVEVRRVAS